MFTPLYKDLKKEIIKKPLETSEIRKILSTLKSYKS